MRLTVFSHKLCWPSHQSPTGYATSGGFSFQMETLSELFDGIRVVVPCEPNGDRAGEIPLTGHNCSIVPLDHPKGNGVRRKLALLAWLPRNGLIILREVRRADAVHVPVPSDIGTFGMLIAFVLHKPLFVRHCGNWYDHSTVAKRFWRWFMEQTAGGRNVMLATGGALEPPSQKNPSVNWVFSSSLTAEEMAEIGLNHQRPSNSLRLIIACRQQQDKGTAVVLHAVKQLIADYPEIRLDVVGDGEYLPNLKSLARELALDSCVTFHGRVVHEAVIELMQQADVFCYPTQASEGFPKVVLEALACGLPVISTRVSVLPYLIKDCAGLLINEAEPEALAAAIKRLLQEDKLYLESSICALRTAQEYTLDRWGTLIGVHLQAAWGTLKG